MASIVLPQALYMIPTNVAKFQSKKLGVSSFLPPFNSASASSISSVSSSQFRLNSGFRNRNSFVVRAESEAEAEAEPESTSDAVETTEDGEDESVNEEAEVVEEKPPKKPIVKLGDIMGILNKQAIEASETSRPVPDLRTGDIIEIKLEVPENRRRLSIYKGIIISRQNAGIHTTIRIRRIIAGVGVEIVFPIILVSAFVGTAIAFACFSSAAVLASRREYLYLGGLLFSSVSIPFWLQFASFIFGDSLIVFQFQMYFGLLVFVGYIMVDTQMIIENAHLGDFDYVKHALTLFTNFVALFVRILIIMIFGIVEGVKRGKSRKQSRRKSEETERNKGRTIWMERTLSYKTGDYSIKERSIIKVRERSGGRRTEIKST